MQKGMFWHAKDRLLEGKRRPFATHLLSDSYRGDIDIGGKHRKSAALRIFFAIVGRRHAGLGLERAAEVFRVGKAY